MKMTQKGICKGNRSSVISQRNKEHIDFEISNQIDKNVITDVKVTENDMITAIEEVTENSTPRPDGTLAIFLKKTKRLITKPVMILMRQNLDDKSEVQEMVTDTQRKI